MMVNDGVNRVSYVVQGICDTLLKQNGRHHTVKQAIESFNRSHQFGILKYHRTSLRPYHL